MNKPANSYGESLKATSITGFAQVVQIAIKIVNTKFIALFLGPAGMGIVGLLQSTTTLVSTISGLGLGNAAVRDVALAVSKREEDKISHIILALRRMVWLTGIGGAIFCLLAASWLSQITFSNAKYTFAFRAMGAVVLFSQLFAGQMALLQGYRKLKEMAIISIIGGLAGLVIAVPLYFFLGEQAIVPALVVLSFVPLISVRFFVKKVEFQPISQSWQMTWQVGRPMLELGFATMVSGLMIIIALWLIRILVQQNLGMAAVGQFQAGWGVTTIYLQMVFQAMNRDYFPKLSATAESPSEMVRLVNEQLHLGLLLATPILLFAIVFAPFIIHVLYSRSFDQAIPQMQWLALGTILKVLSWPLGYVMLALRKSRIFFITETVLAAGFFGLSWWFMPHWELNGIGIAYTINYIFYLFLVFSVARLLIGFAFDGRSLTLMLGSVCAGAGIFFCSFTWNTWPSLFISTTAAFSISIFYLSYLNRLTGLIDKLWKKNW